MNNIPLHGGESPHNGLAADISCSRGYRDQRLQRQREGHLNGEKTEVAQKQSPSGNGLFSPVELEETCHPQNTDPSTFSTYRPKA